MSDSHISIDYGTHKSGLAYSVEGFCLPYKTLPTKDLISELLTIIKEKNIQKIVIGMPYNIDGSESTHCRRVRRFAKDLEKHTHLEIILHDERMTTSEATLGWASDIDTESARLILEDYIRSVI